MKKLPPAPEPGRGQAPASEPEVQSKPEDVVQTPVTAASAAPSSASAGGDARPAKKKKVSRTKARRFARERALQALYQWDLSDAAVSDIRKQFYDQQEMTQVDTVYFEHIFKGVTGNLQRIDTALAGGLDRPLDDLDPIERAVLRVAVHELLDCLETPARVIINEAIEITKRFGADKGHTYINGVLDKIAPDVRPLEMRRR